MKVLLRLQTLLLSMVLIGCVSGVVPPSAEAADSESFGVHLSQPSYKNGEQMVVKADLSTYEHIKQVYAVIKETDVKFPLFLDKDGEWRGTWSVQGLEELKYTLYVHAFLSDGTEVRSNPTEFSDPVFGNTSLGNTAYPEGGLAKLSNTLVEGTLSFFRDTQYDADDGFAYTSSYGPALSRILKIRTSDFKNVAQLDLPNPDWAGDIFIDKDDDRILMINYDSPSTVTKVRLSDFSYQGTFTIDLNGIYPGIMSFDKENDMMYIPTDDTPSTVYKVDMNTELVLTSLTLDAGEDYIYNFYIDPVAQKAYATTYTSPISLVKIDLATMTREDALVLSSDMNDAWLSVPDDTFTKMYVIADTTQSYIARIDLATMTEEDVVPLDVTDIYPGSMIYNPDDDKIYFSVSDTNIGGRIVRVDAATLTREAESQLLIDEQYIKIEFIDPASQYMYVRISTDKGILTRVDLNTFTRLDSIQVNGDGSRDLSVASVADTENRFGYYVMGSTPGAVVKVNLDTQRELDIKSFGTGEAGAKAVIIDKQNQFLYVGINSTTGGINDKILKYNLSNFTLAGTLDLGSNAYNLISASIDEANTLGYFGSAGAPGKVLKVHLPSMTLDTETTLTTSQDNPTASLVLGGYVYLTTENLSRDIAMIVRLDKDTLAVDKVQTVRVYGYGVESFKSIFYDAKVDKIYALDYQTLYVISPDNFQIDKEYDLVSAHGESRHSPFYYGMPDIPTTAVFDAEGGNIYVTSYYPTVVVKIKPREGIIAWLKSLPTGTFDEYSTSVLFDDKTGQLLIGTMNYPSRIITFRVSPEGYISGTKITLPENAGTVDKVKFYSHQVAGNVRLALYDNAKNLVWQSADITVTKENDWQEVDISTGSPSTLANLPAGEYWAAFQTNSGASTMSFSQGNTDSGFELASAYGTFPAAVTGETLTSGNWSIAFVYNTATAPAGNTNYPNGNMKRVGNIDLPSWGDDVLSSVIDPVKNIAYISTVYGEIMKYDITTSKVTSQKQMGALGIGMSVSVLDSTGTYGYYIASDGSPRRHVVMKIRMSDLEIMDTVRLELGTSILLHGMILDPANTYGYIMDDANNRVIKVRLSDMTLLDSLAFTNLENPHAHPIIDSTTNMMYVSVGYGDPERKIIKIDLSTFTRVGELYGPSGDMFLSPDKQYIYSLVQQNLASGTDIKRIKLSDFSVDASAVLATQLGDPTFGFLDATGTFGYFMDSSSDPVPFLKVNLSTLALDTQLALPLGFENPLDVLYDADSGKAFAVNEDYPTKVIRIDVPTFSVETTTTLPYEYGESYVLSFDPVHRKMYSMSYFQEGKIGVFDIDGNGYPVDVELGGGREVDYERKGFFDPSYSFLYWPSSNRQKYYKISTATNTYDGELTLPAGDTYATSVFHPDGSTLYTGVTSVAGRKILKIDPTTLAVTQTSAAHSDISDLVSFVYDEQNDKIIAMTRVGAGFKIIRFDATTLARETEFSVPTVPGFKIPTSTMYNPNTRKITYSFSYNNANTFSTVNPDVLNSFDIDTFAIDASMNAPENVGLEVGTIDIAKNLAYFVGWGGDEDIHNVTQIDLTTMKVKGVLPFENSEGYGGDIEFDNVKGYVYPLVWNGPMSGSRVIKIATSQKGLINSFKYVLPTNASAIDYFRFYSETAGGNIRIGFYDDNKELLWESGSIANTATKDWITVPVSSGSPTALTNIPAGDYWLTFQTDSTLDIGSFSLGSTQSSFISEWLFGTFPDAIENMVAAFDEWTMQTIYNIAVLLNETGGSTAVTEGSATDTYTIVLQAAPESDVTVNITPQDSLIADKASVTFTPVNWNTPQTVTVSITDDSTPGIARNGTITHTIITTDTYYTGKTVPSLTVAITDATSMAVSNPPSAPSLLFANEQTIGSQLGASNPITLGDGALVFSAQYNDPNGADTANKYQIQIATDSGFTQIVHDSGNTGVSMANVTQGARSADLTAASFTPTEGVRYYWRIKFFDQDGNAGDFSTESAFFENPAPIPPVVVPPAPSVGGGGGGYTSTPSMPAPVLPPVNSNTNNSPAPVDTPVKTPDAPSKPSAPTVPTTPTVPTVPRTPLDAASVTRLLRLSSSIPAEKSICAMNSASPVYKDVTSADLSLFIDALQKKGVVFDTSEGNFHAADKINRSEMLRIVVQGSCEFFEKLKLSEAPFPDVKLDHKDSLYIGLAKLRKIVNGYLHDGLFKPEKSITRAEALKIILEVVIGDGKRSFTGTAKPYDDIAWDDEKVWYRGYISFAYEKGIIGASVDKKFLPNDLASREDIIWMFAATIKYRQTY
ncbi:MAG: S-layer homology domain-containing protein [Candidatus Gracilibacteria bacterium]